MYKRLILVLLVGIVVALPLSSATASEIIQSQSEMIQWDPDKAYNGYNLFTKSGDGYLVDMEGYIVNKWEPATATGFGMYGHAIESGNWRFHMSPSYAPMGVLRAGGAQGRIEEYNWDGDRVWWMDIFDGDPQADPTDPYLNATYRFHHDAQRMYNSAIGEWTYLALLWVAKGEADADNVGVDPALNAQSRGTGSTWSPGGLIEILPDYAGGEGGDVIWYWTFADHMVTTISAGTMATTWTDWSGRESMPPVVVSTTTGATDSIQANPQLLDVNGMHYTVPDGPRADYQHCNSIDYDEATGYIAINAKAANEFFVIDHDGTFLAGATANNWDSVGASARTSAGDFLYRFGNPGNYYSGDPADFFDEGDMEMYGTHDIQWIWDYHWRPPMDARDTWAAPTAEFALPGAGNFLMFDNGCYNPTMAGSKILEVNPYILDGDGTLETNTYPDGNIMYVNPGPDAIATPGGTPATLSRRDQVVWTYGGGRNGAYDFYSNYISGQTRMPNGNTIIDSGANSHFFEVEAGASGNFNANDIVWEYIVPQEDDDVFQTTFEGASGTFRFHRFSSSHPALVGKNLRRGNTLTGTVPGTTNVFVPSPTGWGTGNKVGAGGGGGGAAGAGGTGGY